MTQLSARRIGGEEVVTAPVPCRPDRARLETAAAVGADIPEHVRDAIGAEGAFEGADAGLGRVWR